MERLNFGLWEVGSLHACIIFSLDASSPSEYISSFALYYLRTQPKEGLTSPYLPPPVIFLLHNESLWEINHGRWSFQSYRDNPLPKVFETRYVYSFPLTSLKLTPLSSHYSYECKSAAQERPYVSRPSRTQQLQNPKLMPKLTSDVPQDLLRKYVQAAISGVRKCRSTLTLY